MDKGKERNLDVIEIIKKDPSNIKNIDNITEDEYNKIFNYYKEEFDKLMHQIQESKFNYAKAYNHCITQIKSLSIYHCFICSKFIRYLL